MIENPIFRSEDSSKYSLSLLIGPDRLSYLVLEGTKVLVLGDYAFETYKTSALTTHCQAVIAKDSYLRANYSNIDLHLYSKRFTIIPDLFYDEEGVKDYFNMVLPLNQQDHLYVDALPRTKAQLIYAIDLGLKDFITTFFPKAHLHALSSSIIEAFPTLYTKKKGYVVLALIKSRSLSLTILHKNQLLLHQVYGFSKSEDCLYHILNAYKQLGINPEIQELLLGGELVKDSEIYKLLFKYIRHLTFVKRPSYLEYYTALHSLPSHFHYDLFCTQWNASIKH